MLTHAGRHAHANACGTRMQTHAAHAHACIMHAHACAMHACTCSINKAGSRPHRVSIATPVLSTRSPMYQLMKELLPVRVREQLHFTTIAGSSLQPAGSRPHTLTLMPTSAGAVSGHLHYLPTLWLPSIATLISASAAHAAQHESYFVTQTYTCLPLLTGAVVAHDHDADLLSRLSDLFGQPHNRVVRDGQQAEPARARLAVAAAEARLIKGCDLRGAGVRWAGSWGAGQRPQRGAVHRAPPAATAANCPGRWLAPPAGATAPCAASPAAAPSARHLRGLPRVPCCRRRAARAAVRAGAERRRGARSAARDCAHPFAAPTARGSA